MPCRQYVSSHKIITDKQIDMLYKIVDNKINEASNNILNGRFSINPKQIEDNLLGRSYCKYKDICYMTNSDIVTLKKCDNVFEEVSGNASMD